MARKRLTHRALTVRGIQSLLADAHPCVDITYYDLFQQDGSIGLQLVQDEVMFVEYALPFSSESFIFCLLYLKTEKNAELLFHLLPFMDLLFGLAL
jgi:hypothetical protein